ncbi:nucleotidyltransferase [bacterium 1XD21-13]|nr:nucleotidyltransferase [bacterium 1XD21-13]
MKTTGIIAEYNPFHKGHAYQLRKAKELTGADYMVIVMSGPFTQRGLPALVDKYTRTKMALENGADLVLELPVPYASGSAEAFAQGAVALLDSLGCIDTLCFGSESGDLKALISYAKLFEEEPEDYKSLLKYHLKQGLPFPAARSRAAEECLHYTDHVCVCSREDADCRQESELLYHPNNILGIEYCRALLSRRSKIRPVTLRRVSSGYHDTAMDTEFASASAIREAILREGLSKSVEAQLPNASFQILKEALKACPPVQVDAFSSILLYRLLTLSREDLASFQDVSPDLAARIENHRFQFTCCSSFADLLKTKELTHSRITRALCHILLDLRQADLDALKADHWPVYLKPLGFRKSAGPLLAAIKGKSASPLLVKAADASSLLSPVPYTLFEKDVLASHIYESAKVCQYHTDLIHEYTRTPIILP